MRLKLTLRRPRQPDESDDVLVTVDAAATIAELAAAIATCSPSAPSAKLPFSIRIEGGDGDRVAPRDLPVVEAGLASGQTISLVPVDGRFTDERERTDHAARLIVIDGPDAGKQFGLARGVNQLGREAGNDVRLTDPMVSKQHARIVVTDVVEVVDLGSSNGVIIGGERVPRAVIGADDEVLLGRSAVKVEHRGAIGPGAATTSAFHNRAPRLDVLYDGKDLEAPKPPAPPQRQRVPIIPLIAPILMGCILFAVTRQLVTVLFVALSPLMAVGNVMEYRIFGRREYVEGVKEFHVELDRFIEEVAAAVAEEADVRRREQPATIEALAAIDDRSPLLWALRPDRPGFLTLRVGLARQGARTKVVLPSAGGATDLRDELRAVAERFATVDDVPVVADLTEVGSFGVAGPREPAMAVARGLVLRVAGLHSPTDVVLAAMASSVAAETWDWLKWLPHTPSDHSPLACEHLASTPGGCLRLVTALEELIERRAELSATDAGARSPAVLVLIDEGPPVERGRLVELTEAGPAVGVHVVWVASTTAALPGACRAFVNVAPNRPGVGTVSFVDGGLVVADVRLEVVGAEEAMRTARALSPVVDAGARLDDDSDLPASIPLLTLVGPEVADEVEVVVDRWRTSGSLPLEHDGRPRQRRKGEGHLRATVGVGTGPPFVLDLRAQGPHALVGGTTGSGKSEFLQTWVVALALEHSPHRVTFLFVDYKGGSAFSDCTKLPHSVGLVTDLTPHLVKRVLTSLNAELRHREELLNAKRVKDLLELEEKGDPDAPPSLIIVVDEFAALVKEVPDFVDGMVNVAQRGRSLGLHLVLATQRPAGVIKDNLRANTNLRIALRMADADDSIDVAGTPLAADFDPARPGRAMARVGPGRTSLFQSAYLGGWTSKEKPKPDIEVATLTFGAATVWEPPEPDAEVGADPAGPKDLQRLVRNLRAANRHLGLPVPRRPWLDHLASAYDLTRAPQSRNDNELVYAILDDPVNQRQTAAAFRPDQEGNMVVFGTGGSGKSTFLRTLAIVAGVSSRGGPCHVYGLDFGARGLQMLEPLPHVGAIINGEDDERIIRLLRTLRRMIDERSVRYAARNASTIEDFRSRTGERGEPRILVLVDGIGAFRQAYEVGEKGRWFEVFQSIASDGRQMGVHVVLTADRGAAVPAALASVIQKRLVLRLANEMEYASLGVDEDNFDKDSPAGRGFVHDDEVQVLVLGGTADTARQASAVSQLAQEMKSLAPWPPAPRVGRLPERVRLGELPVSVDGQPSLGVADDSLAALGFVTTGVLLVAGPPRSGRTSVLASLILSLRRQRPDAVIAYLGSARSPVRSLLPWLCAAEDTDSVAELAKELDNRLSSREPALADLTVVVEGVPDYLNTAADLPLQELFRACRAAGAFVLAEGETSALASSWPLFPPLRAARHGLVLQPDQMDGESLFKTSLPRIARAEFPPGRGFYVRDGKAVRAQCALPEL